MWIEFGIGLQIKLWWTKLQIESWITRPIQVPIELQIELHIEQQIELQACELSFELSFELSCELNLCHSKDLTNVTQVR